jgi:two-component system response regulator AtoC
MAASSADSSRPARKGKILIVDDEKGIRDLLKTVLEADYHIAEADSGAALHLALEKEAPDVVLLDMNLPDANGLRLLPAIKQRWPATEVIILSGTPHDGGASSWAAEAVRNGAFAFLSKSAGFSFPQILDCVSSAVAVRRET